MPAPVVGAAIIPSAPLMLAAASPAQPPDVAPAVARLRELATAALEGLPSADAGILLAQGARGFHDEAEASLVPLGVAGADVTLPVATEVLEHATRISQYPLLRGQPLGIDVSVLALEVAAIRGEVPVVPVTVPAATAGDVLVAVGAGLVQALRDAGMTAAVVCAGDLSAGLDTTSPRYAVEGAAEWDAAAVEALERNDLDALTALGPEEAGRVAARSWAPLVALGGLAAAAKLRPAQLTYTRVRGVGQVVGRLVPAASADAVPRFQRRDQAAT